MRARSDAGAYPPAGRGWYLVIVLYLAYTLSFVDRQIIAFLVGPIRADLGITDFQFSLVHGLAFAAFYALLGIPIGRLVDGYNRRNIAIAGVGLWSLMTGLCGMASSYWQLFAARLGVGFGEAALSPAAISMIADSFPPEKRGLPINVYSAGVHTGAGLANIFGGMVVAFALAGGVQVVPLLGELKAWQLAFVLVALPGILVVLLLSSVAEPPRRERGLAGAVSIGATLRYLLEHRAVFASLILAGGFGAMVSYGTFSWVPALFERRYGWGAAQIGLAMGFITIACGVLGLVASGALAGRWLRAGRVATYPLLMLYASIATAIPAALLIAFDAPWWTLGCLALLVFVQAAPIGLIQAALQAISPNEMRGQVIAVYLFVIAVAGLGLGPSSVAALTDFVFADDAAVGRSMAIVGAVCALLAAVMFALAIPAYRRTVGSR